MPYCILAQFFGAGKFLSKKYPSKCSYCCLLPRKVFFLPRRLLPVPCLFCSPLLSIDRTAGKTVDGRGFGGGVQFSENKDLCKQLGIRRLPTVQIYDGAAGR